MIKFNLLFLFSIIFALLINGINTQDADNKEGFYNIIIRDANFGNKDKYNAFISPIIESNNNIIINSKDTYENKEILEEFYANK